MPVRPSLHLLAAAACFLSAATPVARAYALSEVRIVQVQLGPDGSFTEIGRPQVTRSFSNGVLQTDTDFFGVGINIAPGGQSRQSWDFAYTVSMHADGLPFPIDPSVPSACAPLPGSNCSPPLDGQSLAWAFLAFGEIGRGLPPWAVFTGTGGGRLQFELHDGSFERSGLVHFEAGSSNVFGWSGVFSVGAVTFAAAIPEPATYLQMLLGLGLLAGVLMSRGRLRQAQIDGTTFEAQPALV